MIRTMFALAVLAVLPAWASEPGQPLDCSDWVFLEPGIDCTTEIPYPCQTNEDTVRAACSSGNAIAADNEGGLLLVKTFVAQQIDCGAGPANQERFELVRIRNGQEEILGYVEERCGNPNSIDELGVYGVVFDDKHGVLSVAMRNSCRQLSAGACLYPWEHAGGHRLNVNGFTTTFETRQTYEPTANALGFRVPVRPEGMEAVDSFDTYWGDLATVGDWSQAQGLQCDYPTEIPSVGEYLTVADTLPSPSPGHGYYFVTAVRHQGEMRYGRKRIGGLTSGRDVAVLPGCEE